MPLRLHKLSRTSQADLDLIPAIARVHLAAWLTNALYAAIYPGPPSTQSAIIEANRQRHLREIADPNVNYAAVLDDNEVVAWVKYDVFSTTQAEESRGDTGERTWPPGTNVALANHFWELIVDARRRDGQDLGAHVSVDLLATDPAHQRRGAGRMLMQFVTQEADRLGLPMAIEGSPEGMRLYESVGFEAVGEIWVDLGRFEGGKDQGGQEREPGVGEGWYKQVAMVRKARSR